MNEQNTINFVKSVLSDANGISEQSYNLLLDMISPSPELSSLRGEVEATDGRFYLPEDSDFFIRDID